MGPDLIAAGQAGGPSTHFNGEGPWLGGIKFTYKYLNLASDDHNISIPQAGPFTTTVGQRVTIPFTGFVPIRNSQIKIKNQFALMPYLGRSFGNFYV
jgi:hypothetical protein